jgi:pyruvate,orthophosphate dikinase
MKIIRMPGARDVSRSEIGGKAWSIHRMQGFGIPVPPAFVIGTGVCTEFFANDRCLPAGLLAALPDAMSWLERESEKSFGGGGRPLLISVRSGAAISMPGMMDTILNLGINDSVEQRLAALTGDAAFAADTHQRFREHFTHTVGHAPGGDPWAQLRDAIAAVFASWQSTRAIAYRRDRGLPDLGGTAVTVQAMVFGNLDSRSGTGVMFTRNPDSGAPQVYGEWLQRGQGEDVVSGRRTPADLDALARDLPDVHGQLLDWGRRLEQDGRDAQDVEFTVESGKLWLLQTRSAKRSPQAAVRIAVAMHDEGLLSAPEALQRITAEQVEALLAHRAGSVDWQGAAILARGRPACAGVASGVIVTDIEAAEARADAGEAVILARPTTNPDDVHVMALVAGVLTELGGATSHAAVVCRELGVPCIVDCGAGKLTGLAGQDITMDANVGQVLAGRLGTNESKTETGGALGRLAQLAGIGSGPYPGLALAEWLRAGRDPTSVS